MTNLRLSRRHILVAASSVLSLAGCSLLPDPPAARIYRVDPGTIDTANGPPLHAPLAIAMPTAPQSLDTDRIALTLGRTRFDYYADSVWTDRVPVLVRSLLVEAFESSGRIADVGRDADGLALGYVLEIDIRAFQARYASQGKHPPIVVVGLALRLTGLPDRRTIGRTLITEEAPAAHNNLDSIVRAFDVVTSEALNRSLLWVLRMMRHSRKVL